MRSLPHLQAAIARARMVGVPILAIHTADPAATIPLALKASASPAPPAAVAWDSSQGLFGLGQAGSQFLSGLMAAGPVSLAEALVLLQRLPENGAAFVLGAHRFLEQPEVAQGIWNLRDAFKADGRTLILLSPHLRLPAELAQDVLVLQEPLPGEAELSSIVQATYRHAELEPPTDEVTRSCAAACRGLSAFAAEQALALSLHRAGVDIASLWERKRQSVEQTPGLSFSIGGPGYESLGGLSQIKKLGAGLFAGPKPPRCIVRVDEMEKQTAGSSGDLTGIAQDFSAVLLQAIQDYGWSGIIAVGPPGSGKSAFSKSLGGEFGVPTLGIDLGAARGSLVGESEQNIRSVMRTIHGLAGESAFWIATCNSVTALPPELRRRFSYGAWMFDLPLAEERSPIWELYLRKFELSPQERPEDALWTGSDIHNCCELAYRLGVSLKEASGYLLPVAKSAAPSVRALREMAEGVFLSASYPGPYRKPDDAITPGPSAGRRIGLE